MRLYFDAYEDQNVLVHICALACHDSNLDLCNVRKLPSTPMLDASKVYPMNWRFFPVLDPQVNPGLSLTILKLFSYSLLAEIFKGKMAVRGPLQKHLPDPLTLADVRLTVGQIFEPKFKLPCYTPTAKAITIANVCNVGLGQSIRHTIGGC